MGNFVPPGSGCLVAPVGAFVVGGSLGDEVEGDDEVGYFVGNAVGYFVPPGRGYLVDAVDGTDVGVVGGTGVGAFVVHAVGDGVEVGCFVVVDGAPVFTATVGHEVGGTKLGAPVSAFVGASVVAAVGATAQTQFPHDDASAV